jgi:competence protein ComEA
MEQEPGSSPASPARAGAGEWLAWFGVGRLLTSALAVVIVCVGAFWLVRSPPPATEAALPVATSVSIESISTLARPAPPSTASPTVIVHVTGAVVEPGVYELGAGERVRSAIEAAGGASPDADASALNLAAPVVDGSRIQVPLVGEQLESPIVVPPAISSGAPAPGSPGSAPVDVNTAGAVELDALPGVGPATAAAIVEERRANGPFVSVDDLDRVPGIGPAKLGALRDLVTT